MVFALEEDRDAEKDQSGILSAKRGRCSTVRSSCADEDIRADDQPHPI
jgi:hypothetical protein